MDFSELFKAKLFTGPPALLLVVFLTALSYFLKQLPWFKNRYIIITVMLTGFAAYPFMYPRGQVPPEYSNPCFIICCAGLVLGMISTIAGASIIDWMVKRFRGFVPAPETPVPPAAPVTPPTTPIP